MQRWLAWAGLVCLLSTHGIALAAIATSVITVFGVTVMRAQLLTNAAAVTNGEWIDVSGMRTVTLDIRGITSATVEVDGSNAEARPADNTHGQKLNGTDITVDQVVVVTMPLRWLKVRVVSFVSGNIQALMEAQGS